MNFNLENIKIRKTTANMKEFTEYLILENNGKDVEDILKYINKNLEKLKMIPGIYEQLNDIKKKISKISIKKPEGYKTKKQLLEEKKKEKEILDDISNKIEEFFEKNVKGGWDYYNNKFKLNLSVNDYNKDYDTVWKAIENAYLDDYGIDDLTNEDEENINEIMDNLFEKGEDVFEGFTRHLMTYDFGTKLLGKLCEKLNCDDYYVFNDIDSAKKAYKIVTGKDY